MLKELGWTDFVSSLNSHSLSNLFFEWRHRLGRFRTEQINNKKCFFEKKIIKRMEKLKKKGLSPVLSISRAYFYIDDSHKLTYVASRRTQHDWGADEFVFDMPTPNTISLSFIQIFLMCIEFEFIFNDEVTLSAKELNCAKKKETFVLWKSLHRPKMCWCVFIVHANISSNASIMKHWAD